MNRFTQQLPALGCAVFLVLGTLLSAQTEPASAPSPQARQVMQSTPAGQLVAKVIDKELHSHDQGRYMFRDWKQTPESTITKELVETKEGMVARLIAINGQPLTPQQKANEDARLQDLLQHPEQQQKKRKEQKQDNDRIEKLFRELPKAFQYEYEGTENSGQGELIRMKFTPKPDYQPPSRETSVFKAMSGHMWVQIPDHRLARIEAALFRDVGFGWGILGHLDKGGHFFVEQGKLPVNDDWDIISMNIQFTGKILFFKTINMRENEKFSEFRRVPDGLDLAQGVELLNKSENQVAEDKH